MNYLLIPYEQLQEKGLFPYAERLPDGRCILPMSKLKAITGFKDVEIVDTQKIKELKKAPPVNPEPEKDQQSEDTSGQNPEPGFTPSEDLDQTGSGDHQEQSPDQPEQNIEPLNNKNNAENIR